MTEPERCKDCGKYRWSYDGLHCLHCQWPEREMWRELNRVHSDKRSKAKEPILSERDRIILDAYKQAVIAKHEQKENE